MVASSLQTKSRKWKQKISRPILQWWNLIYCIQITQKYSTEAILQDSCQRNDHWVRIRNGRRAPYQRG
jgi:hypothetical protein